MKYYQLLENLVSGDFTFGFELECIAKNKDILENLYNSIFTNNNSKYKMNIGNDITIKFNKNEYPNFESFELKSDVFLLSPINIQKCIHFLINLNKNNIHTNKSCSFQVHLNFNSYTKKDGYWLLLNLSVDKNFIEKLTKFKKYNFFNEQYANTYFLEKIRLKVLNFDNELLYNTTDNLLYLHRYNTIEWRGPRDFLNEPKLHEIKDFFMLLYEFVNWIKVTMKKDSLNGKPKEFWLENYSEISKNIETIFSKVITYNDEKYIKILNTLKEKELLKLIELNTEIIKFIENQTDNIQNKAIKQSPYSVRFIKYPNENVQRYILNNRPQYIKFIQNPTIPELTK